MIFSQVYTLILFVILLYLMLNFSIILKFSFQNFLELARKGLDKPIYNQQN